MGFCFLINEWWIRAFKEECFEFMPQIKKKLQLNFHFDTKKTLTKRVIYMKTRMLFDFFEKKKNWWETY